MLSQLSFASTVARVHKPQSHQRQCLLPATVEHVNSISMSSLCARAIEERLGLWWSDDGICIQPVSSLLLFGCRYFTPLGVHRVCYRCDGVCCCCCCYGSASAAHGSSAGIMCHILFVIPFYFGVNVDKNTVWPALIC